MSTYEDLGFDPLLTLKKDGQGNQLSDADFDLYVESISAKKINQGTSSSTKLSVDYDNGTISRKEGTVSRTVMGKFDDGKYGLRVYDASGGLVIDQTA